MVAVSTLATTWGLKTACVYMYSYRSVTLVIMLAYLPSSETAMAVSTSHQPSVLILKSQGTRALSVLLLSIPGVLLSSVRSRQFTTASQDSQQGRDMGKREHFLEEAHIPRAGTWTCGHIRLQCSLDPEQPMQNGCSMQRSGGWSLGELAVSIPNLHQHRDVGQ